MQKPRWIVVGTDFSEGAQCALEQAAEVADRVGAAIALVHAYEDEVHSLSTAADPSRALHLRLEDVISRASANRSSLRMEAFVRRGAPWEKLLNVAVDVGADLIVVGATGQRGTPAVGCLLGSVAYRVVASSTRSVLISRAVFDRSPTGLGPQL